MVYQAVILAAGNGTRIKRSQRDVPKPLRKVCGLTLIKRAILNLKLAGITQVVVVVGYKGDEIVDSLQNDRSLGVDLQFVHNPDYQKSNGLSLLAAKPFLQNEFLFLMADHIFDRRAIEKIVKTPLQGDDCILAIDRKLDDIFDVDDATKVKTQGSRILSIGKEIQDYDAYDTGIFLCKPAFVDRIEAVYREKGDASISEGVKALAAEQKMGTCDISEYFWQDVDTPQALRHAEDFLFNQLRKPTDGWISQNINRRISLNITRFLVRTNLSANHVTGLVTLIGILSGYFVSKALYWEVALGGILFNLSSILDGCDGEMSKLKMSQSKTGEWLDTLGDNLTYLSFFIGVMVGAYRQTHSHWVLLESYAVSFGIAMTLGVMFYYLLRYTNSGSLVTVQKDLIEEEKKGKSIWTWLGKIKFMMKRDFFAMFFMGLCLLNQLGLILHLSLIGANLTWMLVLAYKKEIFKIRSPKVATN